jgi:hypothetical protein
VQRFYSYAECSVFIAMQSVVAAILYQYFELEGEHLLQIPATTRRSLRRRRRNLRARPRRLRPNLRAAVDPGATKHFILLSDFVKFFCQPLLVAKHPV